MGNWRTVQMLGTCDASEVEALRDAIALDDTYSNFHCLSNTNSLCGLNDWPDEEISVVGNLAERNYGVTHVVEQLKELVKVAPSLSLKVHCGGEYESNECVTTITVDKGVVTLGEPEISKLPEISEDTLRFNMLNALMAARRY